MHIWFLSNSVSFDYQELFCHLVEVHSDAPKATLYILRRSQAMLLRYDRLIPNRAKKWKFLHNTRACRQSNSRHGGLKMRTVPFGKSFTWLLSISGRLLSVKYPSFFNQEPLNLLISEIFYFFVISKLKNPIDEKLSVLCIIKHFENIQILRLHLNFHNIFFHIWFDLKPNHFKKQHSSSLFLLT